MALEIGPRHALTVAAFLFVTWMYLHQTSSTLSYYKPTAGAILQEAVTGKESLAIVIPDVVPTTEDEFLVEREIDDTNLRGGAVPPSGRVAVGSIPDNGSQDASVDADDDTEEEPNETTNTEEVEESVESRDDSQVETVETENAAAVNPTDDAETSGDDDEEELNETMNTDEADGSVDDSEIETVEIDNSETSADDEEEEEETDESVEVAVNPTDGGETSTDGEEADESGDASQIETVEKEDAAVNPTDDGETSTEDDDGDEDEESNEDVNKEEVEESVDGAEIETVEKENTAAVNPAGDAETSADDDENEEEPNETVNTEEDEESVDNSQKETAETENAANPLDASETSAEGEEEEPNETMATEAAEGSIDSVVDSHVETGEVDESIESGNESQIETLGSEIAVGVNLTDVSETSGPFFVYCEGDKHKISPAFMFHKFVQVPFTETTPRTNLPPWNATVFLVTAGGACGKNPYYQEAVRRFKDSPRATKELPHDDEWINNVHWPAEANGTFKHLVDRPALVAILGEVFFRNSYGSGTDHDFAIFRATETVQEAPFQIQVVHGIAEAYRNSTADFGIENVRGVLTGKAPRSRVYREDDSNGFCVFVNDVIFKPRFYDTDALIRHATFKLLNEYKECIRPTECLGSDPNAYKCQQGYKFNINMDHTQLNGYVSENIFNGYLAGGVPIYFGAPNADEYVNPKSFVFCNVSTTAVNEFRQIFPDARGGRKNRKFTIYNGTPTDEQLVEYATDYWRPHLEPCLEQVKELDKDDERYNAMLNEPLVLDEGDLEGRRTLNGIEMAYNYLSSAEASLVSMS